MEIKVLKDLMAHMARTGAKRLTIEENGSRIEIEQQPPRPAREEHEFENPMRSELELHRVQTSPAKAMIAAPTANGKGAEAIEDVAGTYISSPMVGTFYRSPSPEHAPFVKEGDSIKKGDVVCIIEAMKVMNEVKADVSGTVKRVLVESGHPVEFGTKLFLIG